LVRKIYILDNASTMHKEKYKYHSCIFSSHKLSRLEK